jgi:mRNA-degrading endonuclease RelE of RelBE toxin-antitoxin system
MNYTVSVKKKVFKNLEKLPLAIQKKFASLVDNLEAEGPVQPKWKNFSKLGKNEYHCHLARSWVACWYHEKNEILIEVYYVGSRENAPY